MLLVGYAPSALTLRTSPPRFSFRGLARLPGRRGLLRDDRQQQEVLTAAAEVERGLAAVDRHRAVARIVVQERAVAGDLVLHVGEPAARAARIDVVAPANAEADAKTLRHRDRGRHDLDLDLIDLAGPERLLLLMRVIRPVRQRQRLVEFAMRGAQPALADRGMRIECALERDLLHVWRKHAQH